MCACFSASLCVLVCLHVYVIAHGVYERDFLANIPAELLLSDQAMTNNGYIIFALCLH